MKRLFACYILIEIVFISALSFGLAGAIVENSCAPDDTIFSLYDKNNTHAAVWNDANYKYKICYSQIFGKPYSETNPHVCNENNIILKLTNLTNAHAYGLNEGLNNAVNVCYGNLFCTLKYGNCSSQEKFIVSLANNTNSHLAADNYYGYKICCSENQTLLPSECRDNGANWFNGETGAIFSTNLPNICKGSDMIANTSDDCCPTGKNCIENSSGAFCKISNQCNNIKTDGTPILRCFDYNLVSGNKSKQCTEDCAHAFNSTEQKAEMQAKKNQGFGLLSKGCTWVGTANNGTCTVVYGKRTDSGTIESCFEIVSMTECADGKRLVKTQYFQLNNKNKKCETSEDRVVEVKCGETYEAHQLPFAGIKEIILSLLGIFSVYLMGRKK